MLQETDIFEWMIKGKTTLIQKDPQKETALKTTDLWRANRLYGKCKQQNKEEIH